MNKNNTNQPNEITNLSDPLKLALDAFLIFKQQTDIKFSNR
jgi:hypothetical protein